MKSTPVTVNGEASKVLVFGSGGGSHAVYGLPLCFLHVVHLWSKVFTYCLPMGIQQLCLMAVRVPMTPV